MISWLHSIKRCLTLVVALITILGLSHVQSPQLNYHPLDIMNSLRHTGTSFKQLYSYEIVILLLLLRLRMKYSLNIMVNTDLSSIWRRRPSMTYVPHFSSPPLLRSGAVWTVAGCQLATVIASYIYVYIF